jgi:hypothetical protein
MTGPLAESCHAFWDTISIDQTKDDNKMASVANDLALIAADAGFFLPDGLAAKLKSDETGLMIAIEPICRAFENGTVDEAVTKDLADFAGRYQVMAKRIRGDVLGNLQVTLDYLATAKKRGDVSVQPGGKFDGMGVRIGAFVDLWLTMDRAWNQLYDGMLRLQRFRNGSDSHAFESIPCPTNSCVISGTYCFDRELQALTVYFRNQKWLWWGAANYAPRDDNTALPYPQEVELYLPGSLDAIKAPSSQLRLVTSTAGACKSDELRDFDLRWTKVVLPTTPTRKAPSVPPTQPTTTPGSPLPRPTPTSDTWCDPVTSKCFPRCKNPVLNGHWGFENGASCYAENARETVNAGTGIFEKPFCDTTRCYPVCTQPTANGDWGNENGQLCHSGVVAAIPTPAVPKDPSSDPRAYCDLTRCYSVCANAPADGGVWGYENGQSCHTAAGVATNPGVSSYCDNSRCYPVCSNHPDNSDWGVENGQSCHISVVNVGIVRANAQFCDHGKCYPVCNQPPRDGSLWGSEKGQSCHVGANTPGAVQLPQVDQFCDATRCYPPCQKLPSDGGSWGWERDTTCHVGANIKARPPVSPGQPEPSYTTDTTLPENNRIGVDCPAASLRHGESMWTDASPSDGQYSGANGANGASSAILKTCRDGNVQSMPASTGVDGLHPAMTCPDLALRQGESQWYKLSAGSAGVGGEVLRQCKDGVAAIVGVKCYPGWQQQGNSCARDSRAPSVGDNNSCTFYNLAEGAKHWEGLPALANSIIPGNLQLSCVDGQIQRQIMCNLGFHLVGSDRCEADILPGNNQPGLPPLPSGSANDPTNPNVLNNPLYNPGGPSMPLPGGIPGSTYPGVNLFGQIIGIAVPIIDSLIHSLINAGLYGLSNKQPSLLSSGQVGIGGQPLMTASGGFVIANLNAGGLLYDSKTGDPVLANQHPVFANVNTHGLLYDQVTGQVVLSSDLLTINGNSVAAPSQTGFNPSLVGSLLGTGSDPLAQPGQQGSATNLNVTNPAVRPAFKDPKWLHALNNPGGGVTRPDAENIPVDPSAGGNSYKACFQGGGKHDHGSKWSEPISGGQTRYSCNNGVAVFDATICNIDYGERNGACYRNCQAPDGSGRWYGDGTSDTFRLDQSQGQGSRAWTCRDGQFAPAGPVQCDNHWGPDVNGNLCIYVYNSCNYNGANYPHGATWNDFPNNTIRSLRCDDGNISVVGLSCNQDADRFGDDCYRRCDATHIHGSSGVFALPNNGQGAGNYSCNNGQWILTGIANCYQGYHPGMGNQCVPDPVRIDCTFNLPNVQVRGFGFAASAGGNFPMPTRQVTVPDGSSFQFPLSVEGYQTGQLSLRCQQGTLHMASAVSCNYGAPQGTVMGWMWGQVFDPANPPVSCQLGRG